jgi:NAD(P)-dependent dehydrogenase (short-subunit alcohol dehydrogenase family)
LNNAGGPTPKSFEESTSEDWEKAIALNFLAECVLFSWYCRI